MVGSKTDEIGDEPQIGATQVFPQKCQNKARGHSLKLQTVVGCSFDCLRVMGGRDDNVMFMHIVRNVHFIYTVMVLLLSITDNKGFSRKVTCIVFCTLF